MYSMIDNFRCADQLVAAAVRNFGFFVWVLQKQIDIHCKLLWYSRNATIPWNQGLLYQDPKSL